jgi:dihydroorotase
MPENDSSLLIRNARLFDPAQNLDERGDVLIADGVIRRVGGEISGGATVIDAGGRTLFPAFCDPHVHFRTPGFTNKEDLDSGCRAALAGGFTSVIQMPNTKPTVDSPSLVKDLTRNEPIELRVMGAVTRGLESEDLADFDALVNSGALGLTDDGKPVFDKRFMRAALEFSRTRGIPIASHAEDMSIGMQGAVRAGNVSEMLAVSGWAPAREWAMVERDIALAGETGGKLHLCHLSTRKSVDFVSEAKSRNLDVTAEVTPHHLTLTAEAVLDLGADAKMNPPLGEMSDREALINGLADGTIDCVATDHAPHTPKEKSLGLERAPFGVVGLETSFPVCFTKLVLTGRVSLARLIEAMTVRPREIFGLDRVGLFEGSRADLVLVDLNREWTVDPQLFQSKGRNCPFRGMKLTGRIIWTVYRGKLSIFGE